MPNQLWHGGEERTPKELWHKDAKGEGEGRGREGMGGSKRHGGLLVWMLKGP